MLTVTIAGTDRTKLVVPESVKILNILTKQVDSAQFEMRKWGSHGVSPSVGQEVVIRNDGTKIFAGRIATIDQEYDKLEYVGFRIACIDYTRDLDKKLVVESYSNMTVDAIIADLAGTYLPSSITLANVDCPVTIKAISFNYEYVSDCLRQLAELTNHDWYVDYDKDLHFFAKETVAAPFDLSDTGGKYIYDSLKIRKDITPVRNTVIVRGGEYKAEPFTVERIGDGSHRIFGTEYHFDEVAVVVTGQRKSVGLDNIDDETNYDCLYNFTEKLVKFRGDKVPTNGSEVKISGRPYLPVLVKLRDNTSISIFSSAEGNDGIYEYKIIDRTIKSKEGARQRARAELIAYSATVSEGEFETYETGLRAGMRIRVQSDLRSVDEYYVINRVETRVLVSNESNTKLWHKVSLMTTRSFDHIDLLQKLLTSKDKEVDIDTDNEVLDAVETTDEIMEMQEVVTVTVETPPYQWGPGGHPQLRWNLGEWG